MRGRDRILVGNGGTHALFCVARVVLDEEDEVLMASPYWPLAPGVFGACGAVCIDVPISQRVYDDPSFDVRAAFERHIGPAHEGDLLRLSEQPGRSRPPPRAPRRDSQRSRPNAISGCSRTRSMRR
jgi:hypothetical protein